MAYEDLVKGNTVTFQLYSTGVISNTFTRVKVLGILPATVARRESKLDIDAIHAQMLPSLPNTAVKNVNEVDFILIELSGGTTAVIGKDWINPTTITLDGTLSYQGTFADLSPARYNALLALLSANGFSFTNVSSS